jgi:hypothetical protein
MVEPRPVILEIESVQERLYNLPKSEKLVQ